MTGVFGSEDFADCAEAGNRVRVRRFRNRLSYDFLYRRSRRLRGSFRNVYRQMIRATEMLAFILGRVRQTAHLALACDVLLKTVLHGITPN